MNMFLRTARFDTLMEFPATENCDKSVYITTTIPLKKHYYTCNPFPHFPTKRRDIITTVLATAAIYYCHCCQCQMSAVLVLLLILTLCLLTAMGHWTFVFYVTTFLGFHILSHTYICWILIFTFFSQYLTINHVNCSFILDHQPDQARPLRHSEFDCPEGIFSAAGLLFFEYLDLVPQVPQLRVGALDLNEKLTRRPRVL